MSLNTVFMNLKSKLLSEFRHNAWSFYWKMEFTIKSYVREPIQPKFWLESVCRSVSERIMFPDVRMVDTADTCESAYSA